MRVCNALRSLYGKDTRSAQVLNVGLSLVWAVLLLLQHLDLVVLDIPEFMDQGALDTFVFASAAALFSLLGLTVKRGKAHQVFKFFGLSLGAVFQGILSNGYFLAYPPLKMMLVVSIATTIWFTGALWYVAHCEGFDEPNDA